MTNQQEAHEMSEENTAPREQLLKIKEVKQRTGLSTSAIYRRMSEGNFPRGYSLGPGTVRWKETEINSWIASLPTTIAKAS